MKWKAEINGFRTYLKLEKGLSGKSVEAYLRDVEKLSQFAELNYTSKSLDSIKLNDLREFIEWITSIGLSARSQSRIISGIKSFFSYLALENIVKENPTDLLESPKISRKLPVVLSIDEINEIIAAIDLSKNEGQRNKAILETLYGCGLRVSELTDMRLSTLM